MRCYPLNQPCQVMDDLNHLQFMIFFFPLKFFEKHLSFQGLIILGKAYPEVQKLLFFMF